MRTIKTLQTISFSSRSQARAELANLKKSGTVAKLVDNGSHFKGSDRWSVSCEVVQVVETLKAPVRAKTPKAKPMYLGKRSTAHSAVQAFKNTYQPKPIQVFTRRSFK